MATDSLETFRTSGRQSGLEEAGKVAGVAPASSYDHGHGEAYRSERNDHNVIFVEHGRRLTNHIVGVR